MVEIEDHQVADSHTRAQYVANLTHKGYRIIGGRRVAIKKGHASNGSHYNNEEGNEKAEAKEKEKLLHREYISFTSMVSFKAVLGEYKTGDLYYGDLDFDIEEDLKALSTEGEPAPKIIMSGDKNDKILQTIQANQQAAEHEAELKASIKESLESRKDHDDSSNANVKAVREFEAARRLEEATGQVAAGKSSAKSAGNEVPEWMKALEEIPPPNSDTEGNSSLYPILSFGEIPVVTQNERRQKFWEKEKTAQNNNILVQLESSRQKEYQSSLTLRIAFNEIDESRPYSQPTRSLSLRFNQKTITNTVDKYGNIATIKTHDVTDAKHEPMLRTLFPHVAKDYFENLRATLMSSRRLTLTSIPYNGQHFTCDLYNTGKAYGKTGKEHNSLKESMRHPQTVYVLSRAKYMSAEIAELAAELKALERENPIDKFFVSESSKVTVANVKPPEDRPHILAVREYAFQSWPDYAFAHGLSAIGEEEFTRKAVLPRHAKAYSAPIPDTHDRAFYMILEDVEIENDEAPTLQVGDSFTVHFHGHVDVQYDEDWSGEVTNPIAAFKSNTITTHIRRKWDKKKREYLPVPFGRALLSMKRLNCSPQETLTSVKKLNRADVTLFPKHSGKTFSRIMYSLLQMYTSRKMEKEDPKRRDMLKTFQGLLQAKDIASLPKSGLYDILPKGNKAAKIAEAKRGLNDEQLAALAHWEKNLVATVGITEGAGGSGKTHLLIRAILPFLNNIMLPKEDTLGLEDDLDADLEAGEITPAEPTVVKAHSDSAEVQTALDLEHSDDEEFVIAFEQPGVEPFETPFHNDSDDGDAVPTLQTATGNQTEELVECAAKILLVAAQNETVDGLYDRAGAMFPDYCRELNIPTPIVCRAHSFKSEADILRNAKNASNSPELPCLFNEGETSMLAEWKNIRSSAHLIRASYAKEATRRFYGIRDTRVTRLQGSVAYFALEVAGQIPMRPEFQSKWGICEREAWVKKFQKLDEYEDRMINQLLTGEDAAVRNALITKLFDLTYSLIDVVVTTLSNSLDHAICSRFKADIIALEEAGRVRECEQWGLFSLYHSAKVRLFIGDTEQLPPTLYARSYFNGFFAQGTLAMILRLKVAGLESPRLWQTERYSHPMFTKLLNTIYGENQVVASNAALMRQGYRSHFLEFVHTVLNEQHPIVLLDILNADARLNKAKSKCNPVGCVVSMHCITSLIRHAIPGREITYITPYKGQLQLIGFAREYAARRFPNLAPHLEQVQFSTVDSYMGKENSVTVVDVVVSEDIGFLDIVGRVTVMISRARDGMAIVMNAEHLNNGSAYYSMLRQVINVLKNAGAVVPITAKVWQRYPNYDDVFESVGLDRLGFDHYSAHAEAELRRVAPPPVPDTEGEWAPAPGTSTWEKPVRAEGIWGQDLNLAAIFDDTVKKGKGKGKGKITVTWNDEQETFGDNVLEESEREESEH